MQNYICGSCGNSFEAAPDTAGMIVCAFCGEEIPEKDAEIPLEPGTRIDGYEILRHLGSGGSADVYLAEQSLMERKVALKLLKAGSMDSERVSRFFEEARKTAMFEDRHVVSVLAMVSTAEGYHYLATRYLEGETLEALLAGGETFSEARALWIVIEVASGLSSVWEKHKMFHRDIKPGNIMLTRSGEVMILDMGIAQSYGESSLVNGEVEGSPYYMSPEQARGEQLSWSTDLYSLGVTLYQMLTGKYLYDAPTVREILEKHHNASFPDLSAVAPQVKISPKTETLLRRMLGKTPSSRFASWKEFLAVAKSVYEKQVKVKPAEPLSCGDTESLPLPFSIPEQPETFRPLFRRRVLLLSFLTFLLLSVLSAGLILFLAGRKNSRYAERCLLEAADVVEEKNWQSAQLEEVLEEFRDVIHRFGVKPSVRHRFALYKKQAEKRKELEEKEFLILDKFELQTAEVLKSTAKDLEAVRKIPAAERKAKKSAYMKIVKQIHAERNLINQSKFELAGSRKRKGLLLRRLGRAAWAIQKEFVRECGIVPSGGKAKKQQVKPSPGKAVAPAKKTAQGKTVAPAKKTAQGKTVAPAKKTAQGKTVAPAKKPTQGKTVAPAKKPSPGGNAVAKKKSVPKKRIVSAVKRVPSAKKPVLTGTLKRFVSDLVVQKEVERFSTRNPLLLRRLRFGPERSLYYRLRTLLSQGRTFHNRIYDSRQTFTNEEIWIGALNKKLKIFTIHKDRIHFRNETEIFTFSQIRSADWFDFLQRIAVKEGLEKNFEAYVFFTENCLLLDEKTLRNPAIKIFLQDMKKIHREILNSRQNDLKNNNTKKY
ncbi:MAG: protein kinase [Lentisphaeria bacterium]|nr:protein kinase [Lentisphaeria bacterium]